MRKSNISLLFCVALLIAAQFLYYPKWKMSNTEATLSWDVSGYYFYLPAAFIYSDLNRVAFRDSIITKYSPSTSPYQAFDVGNGNRVMKYSLGQAISFIPGFLCGHLAAKVSSYPADGFSFPYQLSIAIWSIIVAILGLFILRKVLLEYFNESTTAIVLVVIVFTTNYLNYAGIDSALTHNYLFTIYLLLVWTTIKFYKKPSFLLACVIGGLIGWATLTRPTEIISCIIPIFWGIWSWEDVKNRFSFFSKNIRLLTAAIFICIAVGSLQLIYWKFVTGEWIYYTYQDQTFSWLRPHVIVGLFSYKTGWFVYSPLVVLGFAGYFIYFMQKSKVIWATGIAIALAMYITFAWDDYLYGGSLGSRAMIQYYGLLALPMAALVQTIRKSRIGSTFLFVIIGISAYYNFWLTHQAHRGGFLPVGQVTKEYFWATVGKWNLEQDVVKLLDNPDYNKEAPEHYKLIADISYADSTKPYSCSFEAKNFNTAMCLDADMQFSPEISLPISTENGNWLRINASVFQPQKEWNIWQMPQMVAKIYSKNQELKTNLIRLSRLLEEGEERKVWMDVKLPPEADEAKIHFWNAGSQKTIAIESVQIIQF